MTTSSCHSRPRRERALLVLVVALSSLVVALLAGLLAHADGRTVSGATLFGGGAFIAAMTLCMSVLSSLGCLQ